MITFAEARSIAAAQYFKQAQDQGFEFEPWVADWGFENQNFYQVVAGDKLWLVEGIEELAPIDDIVRLVNKATGEYLEVNALQILDTLGTFVPVGNAPSGFH